MVKQAFDLGNGHVILVETAGDQLQFSAMGPSGNARFLTMRSGGGHIELSAPGNLPDGTGLQLDEGRHAVFNLQ